MARRTILYSVTAAALVGVAAFASMQLRAPDLATEDGAWLVNALPQQFRLYSGEQDSGTGAVDAKNRSVETLNSMGVATQRFVINRDDSTEDDELKADGEHIASSIAYYPERPRGSGRHKQAVRLYSTKSDIVVDEQLFRFKGSLSEHTASDEAGGKHIEGFGLDGKRLIREVTIAKPEYKWQDPVLQKENRWSDDEKRVLLYENAAKPDKSRTITEWAENGQVTKLITAPESGVAGTTVIAYYPGTNQVRVEGKASYYSMDANYYRLDGTLDHTLEISTSMLTVKYFDPSGKKELIEQCWWRHNQGVNGVRKFAYSLYWVKEMGPDGKDQREFTYETDSPGLGYIELHDVELNGQKFAEVDYNYDKETGFLKVVRYWKTMGHGADIEEPHELSEKIAPPSVPAIDLKMGVDPEEDDLPVPPPQRSPYG